MRITFHGAAGRVTGSCHLLDIGERKVLFDCGMLQGSRGDEHRNADPFPFEPADIDAVILSHAHIDHSGRLPLLVKRGFDGPIHATPATIDLCEILLRDAAFINEMRAKAENRRRGNGHHDENLVKPVYSQLDVERCMKQFRALPYDRWGEVIPGVECRFHDAGHILGAAIVEAWLSHGGIKRRLVFSGDLGHAGGPLLRDPTVLEHADVVLCEATYGDRNHRPWKETWQEVGEILCSSAASAGNILIPSFAVGRTQDLLYLFEQHYDDWGLERWQVFLDSPLAIRATEIYERHWKLYEEQASQDIRNSGFSLPNLKFSETAEQSMALNDRGSGAIIIAGSGMCNGGRIRHHLKHHAWRSGTQVMIVGYQAEGTPGRALVDGTDELRIGGEPVKIAAQVHTVGGLSAHADQKELRAWLGNFRGKPPVVLVHGESRGLEGLRGALHEDGWPQVDVAAQGACLNLAALPNLMIENEKGA
ncbi:MAG: MBL fold metallo-hydrolase [Gammaproteobacteria bacterium]|nr:MBL fold metallo-hydrolase [Gammaproteobacteria bacterium]